jgi:hypothetical protein
MKRLTLALLALLCVFAVIACGTTSPATAASPGATRKAAAPTEVKLIDNCEGQGIGGEWAVYSDAENDGGSSTSEPKPFMLQNDPGNGADGTNGYAKCWGTVTKQYQYGFSGLTYNFTKDESPIDISSYTGYIFWMKGDGGFYNFAIKSPVNKDFAYYEYGIKISTEWKRYMIPFTKFFQETWGQTKSPEECLAASSGFQIQTVGQPISHFEFSIDEVSLYK